MSGLIIERGRYGTSAPSASSFIALCLCTDPDESLFDLGVEEASGDWIGRSSPEVLAPSEPASSSCSSMRLEFLGLSPSKSSSPSASRGSRLALRKLSQTVFFRYVMWAVVMVSAFEITGTTVVLPCNLSLIHI